jgi:TetR/AcrR family fatty acid metabolism transcriptional regulator
MPTEQARRLHRHERILEAALQVFTRKGYHGAAVDEIAIQSGTSKGGIYFHFPNKEAIFLALLDRMAALLRSRVEAAIALEPSPVRSAEVALQVVLHTFASHRTLARLFLVDALGAGPQFEKRLVGVRQAFAGLIQEQLDAAIQAGAAPGCPFDTRIAGLVWFGALNEVVTNWAISDRPGDLEDAYPTLRVMLLRSLGIEPACGDGEVNQ